jgi:hypothetical protein
MQTLVETDLTEAADEELAEFLSRARPLLATNDALGVLERRRLREARESWKEKHRIAVSELESWRSSWLGRIFGKRG